MAAGDGTIAVQNNIVRVAIPAGNLGLAYAPHAVAAIAKPGKHTFLVDEHSDVTLGDQHFDFGPWVASAATRHGDRMLVSIAARCVTAVISAPKDRVQADVQLGSFTGVAGGGTAIGTSNADRYYLPTGTKVTSETGDHVVGTLSAELDVTKPTAARACGDFVITDDEPIMEAPHVNEASRPDRTLRLCAPAAAVKLEARSRY